MMGYKFKMTWEEIDVWVYQVSEPPGLSGGDVGPASTATEVELPDDVAQQFRTNGTKPARAVLVNADDGDLIKRFDHDWK
jgi:hypothetical protein|tara:strand:- start:654 stop:893 length:240 start_codon:yes stop_codon:yes gene_type:complete